MKKRIIIVVSILLVLIGIVFFFLFKIDSFRFKVSYEYINMMEYNNGKKIKVSIPFKNNIKYVDEKELLNLFKNGNGFIYFGYNTCPWCRNSVPVLIDYAVENNLTIYYADYHSLDLTSIKDELIEYIGNYLREDENSEKIMAVPDIYYVKDGKILGHHLGTVDSYKNPYIGMNTEQKEELLSIYNSLCEGE